MDPQIKKIDDRTVACFPKGAVLDVYFGLDEDAGGMVIIDRAGLKWACEKVAREAKKDYNIEFNESMLKEKITVCMGFQNELDMEHFVGSAEELRAKCLKSINEWNDRCMKEFDEPEDLRGQKEMYEGMIKFLEEDLAHDEWICDVPEPGRYAPSIC